MLVYPCGGRGTLGQGGGPGSPLPEGRGGRGGCGGGRAAVGSNSVSTVKGQAGFALK